MLLPGRVALSAVRLRGRPHRRTGRRGRREKPGPRDPGADVESLSRGAPVLMTGRIHRVPKRAWRASRTRSQRLAATGRRHVRGAGDRDTVPVTMTRRASGSASGESWGRLARAITADRAGGPIGRCSPPRVVRQRPRRRPAATGCFGSSTPRTSISAPATTTSASRRPPSASGSSPRSRRPSTSRSPRRSTSFLIAGDLFDSNVQPRRSVERVAAELTRLAEAQDPDRHHPGHPRRLRPRVDLPRLRPRRRWPARRRTTTWSRSSTRTTRRSTSPPATPSSTAAVFATKRAPTQPAAPASTRAASDPAAATWQVGMVHGSLAIPGKTDRDEVVITTRGDRRERPRLPRPRPLALGAAAARPARVTYAYSGAPGAGRARPGPGRQGRSSSSSTSDAGERTVTVEERPGRQDPVREARPRRRDRRRASRRSSTPLAARADPDLVLDVRLDRRPPGRARPRHRRDRDAARAARSSRSASATCSMPALTEGAAAVAGHDRRRVHPRPRGAGSPSSRRPARRAEAAELRDVAPARPAAARRPRGDAVRIRRLSGRDFRRYRDARHRARARADRRPRPERGRQDDRSSAPSSSP